MLDLLARHGRLDLDVTVAGDLQTGAHHTVEDTGIVLGQALDRALGDRARDPPLRPRAWSRWTRRAPPCAIDISGPAVLRRRRARRCRRATIAGFEHELAEEFFRAVASAARLTLHLELQAGTNAHHMIEALLQGVRARAARRRRRSTPTRPACRRPRGR